MKQENQVKQICSLVLPVMHEISINLVEWVGTGGKKVGAGVSSYF